MRIVKSRRSSHLSFEHLKKIGVVLKRAKYFITCEGKMMYHMRLEQQFLTRQLTGEETPSTGRFPIRNSISSFLCLMLPYLGIYNPGRSSHGKAFLPYLRFLQKAVVCIN